MFKRLIVLLVLLAPLSVGQAAQNQVQTSTTTALPGLTLVQNLNSAALNFITLNSGASAPTVSSLFPSGGAISTAGVIWHDTASNGLKIRNLSDSAWVRFLDIDETNNIATADIPIIAGSSALSVSMTEHYGEFVATAAQNFSLAQTATLWNGFAFSIFAETGNATVAINGADRINGGSTGVGATVPFGYVGEFRTDGAGNWYLHLQPSTLGTGAVTVGSATVDICSVANPYVVINGFGPPAITSFSSNCQAGQVKILKFAVAVTLTHNATSLILPGAANINAQVGDTAIVVALGSGNYIVVSYQPVTGASVLGIPTSPIVGLARSVSLSMSVPLSSAAFKATQMVVATGLGIGAPTTMLPSYSQTLTVSGTGAGGMDTGTTPASGFLDVYAIYSPSAQIMSVLGCADTICNGTPVYSGSNMPGGYTQSGLLAVVPTDAVKDIMAGGITDNKWCYGKNSGNAGWVNIFTGHAAQTTLLGQSIAAAVPPSAISFDAYDGTTTTAGQTGAYFILAGDANGTGFRQVLLGLATSTGEPMDSTFAQAFLFVDVPIYTPQMTYFSGLQAGLRMDVSCYRIKGVS